jgi:hypothetical protein
MGISSSCPFFMSVDSDDITSGTSPSDWTVKALSSRHHPPRIKSQESQL